MTDSPDWTDFSQSDPGITLLELFPFLAIVGIFGAGLISIWLRRRRRRRLIH